MTYHAPVLPLDIRRRPQSTRRALCGRGAARGGLALAGLVLAAAAGAGDPATIARRIVAGQLGIELDATRAWSVTARTFGDGSLDCPEPGMAYAQVLTPGHVVQVEAEGRRFDVRVAGEGGRICYPRKPVATRPARPAAPPAPALATDTAADRARRDLAGLLGIDAGDVALVETHARGPREALPGCGAAPAAAGETVLTLTARGRTWQYLGAGDSVRPCPPAATR